MNILFLYFDKFPKGSAGANRILTIGKSLVSCGHSFTVFIIRPTEDINRIANKEVSGLYDGINYEYLSGTTIWKPSSKVKKMFLILKGVVNSLSKINALRKERKIDFIIAGFSYFSYNLIYYVVSKIINSKYLYNVDEYPWRLIYPDNFSKFITKYYEKYFIKLFDGMIVMTTPLISYYKSKGRRDMRVFHLPMTVDPDRFINIELYERKSIDIVYCGSMSIYKDGVDILVEAFCQLASRYPKISLVLIGPNDDKKSIELINKIVSKYKLKGRVRFTGEVDREMIPSYLVNSDILTLSRPNSKQAEGGFPTKLGEYLMTGNPVVVTNVGEIPNYLKDRETAFIAEPNNVNSFKEKIDEILQNREDAIRIGLNGREIAMRNFNYKVYTKTLEKYLLEEF